MNLLFHDRQGGAAYIDRLMGIFNSQLTVGVPYYLSMIGEEKRILLWVSYTESVPQSARALIRAGVSFSFG